MHTMENRKKGWPLACFLCILATVLTGFASPCYADTDATDLSVGMKTVPLLNTKLTGTVELAIIFDNANPGSKREAEKIKSILDGGFQALGDLKLIGVL